MENSKLEFPGSEIVTVATARHVSNSPLRGANILLTGGPTPVAIDDVRRLTNIFKGRLGLEIGKELVIRGANPTLLLGGGLGVPEYLRPFTTYYSEYDQYSELVLGAARASASPSVAILSAAVADYRPQEVFSGKIASKAPAMNLPPFVPTAKVVELLHAQNPGLPIVSFKLLSRVTEDELLAEARRRLSTHSELVVANRLEDCSRDEQTVYLVGREGVQRVSGSKRDVARAIVDAVEEIHAASPGSREDS